MRHCEFLARTSADQRHTKIVILPQGVSFKEIAISERNQVKSDSLAIDNIHPSIDGIYIKYSRQPKILQFHK